MGVLLQHCHGEGNTSENWKIKEGNNLYDTNVLSEINVRTRRSEKDWQRDVELLFDDVCLIYVALVHFKYHFRFFIHTVTFFFYTHPRGCIQLLWLNGPNKGWELRGANREFGEAASYHTGLFSLIRNTLYTFTWYLRQLISVKTLGRCTMPSLVYVQIHLNSCVTAKTSCHAFIVQNTVTY